MKTEKKEQYHKKTMAAMNITICPNGDQYIRKKLVLNRRRIPNLDVLLDNATQLIGARNCVRILRTPNHGTRIKNLDNMVDGGVYVAIVGPSDKLKKIEYTGQIRPPQKPANDGPRRKARITAQARAFQEGLAEASRYRIIYVYRNGEDKIMKMLLDKRLLYSIDKVLQHISDKLKMRTAVKSIYDLEGHLINEISKIENNGIYVAVGYGQRFKKMAYNKQDNLITPRRPVQSKFSGSTDSSKKKVKQLRQNITDTLVDNSPVKNISINEKEEVTNDSDDGIFAKLTDAFEEQVDDTIDNHLAPSDNGVQDPNENRPMSISPDNGVSPPSHTMDVSPGTSPLPSPTEPNENDESSEQANTLETALHREETFDKQDDKKSTVNETVKKPKKKSKAFGSSFEKALAKTERSNTLDSNKSDKNRRKSSVILSDDDNDTRKPENEGEVKQRKKSKNRKSIQNDSLEIKQDTFTNDSPRENTPREQTPVSRPSSSLEDGNKDDEIDEEIEDETEKNRSPSPPTKSDSPALYQASGEQSEKADQVNDNRDTQVEKTIDMLPAEEIEEEEIESEDHVEENTKENEDLGKVTGDKEYKE